ncbi:MAG: metallophosphoesterase [Candidatus Riflebacteria bacterium]|nr:metallophosphoesterase [Candidatus Riflebacteria bacterium]
MKKIVFLIVLATLLPAFTGCLSSDSSSSGTASTMTLTPGILMSDKVDTPIVSSEPVQIITFKSDLPLDLNSASGSIKLYRINSQGGMVEEPCISSITPLLPTILNVSKKDGTKFTDGEEYEVVISNTIRSTDGSKLGKDFIGYFATNYSFIPGIDGLADLNSARTLIVCISDLHLGANAGSVGNYAEFNANKNGLVKFLENIRISPNVKELVIAGDLLDEWFVPMAVDTFEGKTQADFVKKIADNNSEVMTGFKNIIADGKIKVTYVPGNHDILISEADIQSILPGISQARDVRGLGAYTPTDRPEIVFEHGHRYNYFCAPDPISNRSITKSDSILPPGYFFTRVATTCVVEGHPQPGGTLPVVTLNSADPSQGLLFLYWNVWKTLMTQLPIKEGFGDKILKTNIDGFTDTYSINDFVPFQNTPSGTIDVNLFKGEQDTWDQRQTSNLVSVKIPVKEAITQAAAASELDAQAITQYFQNPDSNANKKRIVVFGHTHQARIIPSVNLKSQKTVYANSGTWIDDAQGYPTMTYAVIVPPKANTSATEYINLYNYSGIASITKLDAQVITLY